MPWSNNEIKSGGRINLPRMLASYYQYKKQSSTPQTPGGRGGYLVHLSDRDKPFFRASFSSNISQTGYQKMMICLEPVVKICQKGNFVKSGCYLVQFLCLGVCFEL